jgi:hypothetical protein
MKLLVEALRKNAVTVGGERASEKTPRKQKTTHRSQVHVCPLLANGVFDGWLNDNGMQCVQDFPSTISTIRHHQDSAWYEVGVEVKHIGRDLSRTRRDQEARYSSR